MNSDQYLLGGRFAPVTFEFGFVKQSLEAVVAARQRSVISSSMESSEPTRVRGTLESLFGTLQPLVPGFYPYNPRELFVSCGKEGEWTAYFNCSADRGLPHYMTWVLAELLRCESLVVSAVPFEGSRVLGENSFYHLQPAPFGTKPEYTFDRSIYWGDQGDGQLLFDSKGEPSPFEHEGRYQVAGQEQLPLEALIEYSRAIGIDPFEESFYSDTAVLLSYSIKNYEFQPEEMLSLSDARTRLGIKDQNNQVSPENEETKIQYAYPKRIRHLVGARFEACIRAAAVRAADYIPLEELELAFSYIDHREVPMGIEALAWTIVEKQVKVPASIIAAILKYEDPTDDLPPNLDDYALPE